MIERYKNLSGESAIVSFKIEEQSIEILFDDGGRYLYNYHRPGSMAVEKMKSLALNGRGLNTYISQHVKKNYSSKLK